MTKDGSKRLLILDLDETLIYGTETELARPVDFRVGPFYLYRRPHLNEFLATVADWYRLAIWSSATIDYVSSIAHHIRPVGTQWLFVWGRDRCIRYLDHERFETIYLKGLKKVKRFGFDLQHILIVDDTPAKLSRNYGNAIYVTPYEGALADDELPILLRNLESIRAVDDYRSLEKRDWKMRIP